VVGTRKSDTTGTASGITCLDDVPGPGGRAARQEFLSKWYGVLTLVPLAVLVFIAFKFFPGSNSWTQVILVFVALIWALSVAGYAFYLFFVVRCPVCKSRFGTGANCRSCGLPRHRGPSPTSENVTPRS
jgi:hypothetical protein